MKKRFALLLAVLLLFVVSAAQAQEVSCKAGRFSLTLPDSFSAISPLPQDQDLVFGWQGDGISLLGYATQMGKKVQFNDLFQILTGNETESGMLTIRKQDMLYAQGNDENGAYTLYCWLNSGVRVELYFYYSAGNPDSDRVIKNIIHSLSLK